MFEKRKSYTYDEIEIILNETRDWVMKDLETDADERLSNSMSAMMFKMNAMLVLGLYQARLLSNEEK